MAPPKRSASYAHPRGYGRHDEPAAIPVLHRSGRTDVVILLDPLPRRVRLRLWVQHRIDGAAIWLVERDRFQAAKWLWKLTGGWD